MVQHFLAKDLADFSTFAGLDEITNYQCDGAQLLWANYSLLRQDFPFLSEFDDSQIKTWLIDHFSSVSERQFLLQGLRTTKIPTNRVQKRAYRQRYHGRGDILPVTNPVDGSHAGFIDRKGSGIHFKHLDRNLVLLDKFGSDLDSIRKAKKTNGLLYIGQALRELHMDAVERLLATKESHLGIDLPGTVGNYAVIQLPFGIFFDGQGSHLPGALVLRQANVGRIWLPEYLFPETVNINGATFFGDVVDAGSFLFKDKQLFPCFQENWVKDPSKPKGQTGLPGYKVLQDLVRDVLDSSDPQAVIDEHLQLMSQQLASARQQKMTLGSLDTSLEKLLKRIIKTPETGAHFLQGFHFIKRREQSRWLNSPLLEEAIQSVLSLDKSLQTIDGFGRAQSIRSLAVPLIPLLPDEMVAAKIVEELNEPSSFNQVQILSEYSWLINFDKFEAVVNQLVKVNPEHFVQSLAIKLLEPDVREFHNFPNLMKMSSMALQREPTRRLALESFTQLSKQGADISMEELSSNF